MKNYSYVGISLVILIFGIWAVPKIIAKFTTPDMAEIGEVPKFSFTNQDGETITNEDYRGKVYVVEFFFTTCPTICPKMNENMVKIQNEFYGNPNFGIASFSIYPEHDTPKVLKAYAEEYGVAIPNWNMLTGEREAIFELANTGFNLYVAENKEMDGNFEHSGYFALVDQEGVIRSRYDDFGNPIAFYNGLDKKNIEMLKEDIKNLL
ncbi:SCO family protein [Mesonia ostreae]|uniref:SCO family protein n=1 Tax=Mesonia ostreae TaxID=861110 RepID=A0ABU2KFH8_9FLAO|nr:SCO family protein [Mesonia ostreae]MDT0293462.1 SCO family protein [Mesonia ostreae]